MTTLQLLGTRTAYDVDGSGRPILLVHGAEADRRSFAALGAELSRRPFTVVRPDQRGCGESVPAADDGHGLAELADDAAELMGVLGHPRYAVFGTSFGGRVAQALAFRHPDRVEALILCNTWPLDASLATLNPAGHARLQTLRQGLPGTAQALAEAFYTAPVVAERPDLVARCAQWLPAGRRAALALMPFPVDGAPPSQPTLLITGDADEVVPTAIADAMAAALPHARRVRLPGIGHAAAVQAPALIAAQIAGFLDGRD